MVMVNSKQISTTDIGKLTADEGIGYADSDIVIVDDLRNFSKLQTIKVDFLLIVVVKSGRLDIKANHEHSTASCNDILICQPNTIMNDCMFSIDFTAKAVCISAERAHRMLHISEVVDLSFYLKYKPIIHIDDSSMKTFEKYHALLSEQLLKDTVKYKQFIVGNLVNSFLFCLLSIIEQAAPQRKSLPVSRESLLFKQFIEMLTSLEVKPRKAEFYSKQLCVTSKYLSNVCKENSGKTAYEWIVDYVVQDVERLLSHSDMSIKEIANYLDFPNLSFFGKFVKAHLGVSPTEYRRMKEGKGNISYQ